MELLEHFGTPCHEPDGQPDNEQCLYCRTERPASDMLHVPDGTFCNNWECRPQWIADNMVLCLACEAAVRQIDVAQIDRTDDWICDECMDDPGKLFGVICRLALVIASHKETNNE